MLIETPSGILKYNDIYLLQLGQFMYFYKNSFLPPRFNKREQGIAKIPREG